MFPVFISGVIIYTVEAKKIAWRDPGIRYLAKISTTK